MFAINAIKRAIPDSCMATACQKCGSECSSHSLLHLQGLRVKSAPNRQSSFFGTSRHCAAAQNTPTPTSCRQSRPAMRLARISAGQAGTDANRSNQTRSYCISLSCVIRVLTAALPRTVLLGAVGANRAPVANYISSITFFRHPSLPSVEAAPPPALSWRAIEHHWLAEYV